MSGYILDDLALIAGMAATGDEHHRRELSRLLHGAIDGGPSLTIPAMCLATAATTRPGIAGHIADILAAAPTNSIDVCGLTRTAHLDALRALRPDLDWPATHAAAHALATGLPVLTTDPTRYAGVGLDVLPL